MEKLVVDQLVQIFLYVVKHVLYYSVRDCPRLVCLSVLTRMDLAYPTLPSSCSIHFEIVILVAPKSLLFCHQFSILQCCACLISLMLATCPAHVLFLHLIT